MRSIDESIRELLGQEAKKPEKFLVAAALLMVGIKEVGDNKGPLIEAFQKVTAAPNGSPWCLSFIQALIAFTEKELGLKSPLPNIAGVFDLWNTAPRECRLALPEPGSIALWKRVGSPAGHCGLVLGAHNISFATVEGNTSNSIHIDREGDGVFFKIRPRGGLGAMVELGFLKIFL